MDHKQQTTTGVLLLLAGGITWVAAFVGYSIIPLAWPDYPVQMAVGGVFVSAGIAQLLAARQHPGATAAWRSMWVLVGVLLLTVAWMWFG